MYADTETLLDDAERWSKGLGAEMDDGSVACGGDESSISGE